MTKLHKTRLICESFAIAPARRGHLTVCLVHESSHVNSRTMLAEDIGKVRRELLCKLRLLLGRLLGHWLSPRGVGCHPVELAVTLGSWLYPFVFR